MTDIATAQVDRPETKLKLPHGALRTLAELGGTIADGVVDFGNSPYGRLPAFHEVAANLGYGRVGLALRNNGFENKEVAVILTLADENNQSSLKGELWAAFFPDSQGPDDTFVLTEDTYFYRIQ